MQQDIDFTVDATCPSCGTTIPAGQKNCPNCHRARASQWPMGRVAMFAAEPVPPTNPMGAAPSLPPPPQPSLHAHGDSGAVPAVPATAEHPAHPVHYSRGIVWLEFLLGTFGIHGVGFFLIRRPGTAIGWLIFSLIWDLARAAIIAATLGLGLVCLIPAGLLVSLIVTFSLLRSMRRIEHQSRDALAHSHA